jgi:hypothetical protein
MARCIKTNNAFYVNREASLMYGRKKLDIYIFMAQYTD